MKIYRNFRRFLSFFTSELADVKKLIAWADRKRVVPEGIDLIQQAVAEQWGERCPDFHPDCACCQAWAAIDVAVDAHRIAKTAQKSLKLEHAIRQALHDLDLVEYGEGVRFNLNFVIKDLKDAVK